MKESARRAVRLLASDCPSLKLNPFGFEEEALASRSLKPTFSRPFGANAAQGKNLSPKSLNAM